MHYNVQLGLLAAHAMREFSRAANSGETDRYPVFLQRSEEYCQAARHTYGRLTDEHVINTIPENLAAFMRAVIKNQQPSPETAAKLTMIKSLQQMIEALKVGQNQPSPEQYFAIAQKIYSTSSADPR